MIEIYQSVSGSFRLRCDANAMRAKFPHVVSPAKAGIQASSPPPTTPFEGRLQRVSRLLSGIAHCARDLNGYLWVADPRQVSFLCSCKEKKPKESTPRSRRKPLALLARAGARQLVGRKPRGSTRTGARLTAPARAAMLGGGYGDPKTPPRQGLRWVATLPVSQAEHRARPGVFACLLIEPEARFPAPGELGERPAEARRAGHRASWARRSDPGVLSLVPFFARAKKGTQGAGAEPPAHIRLNRGRRPLDSLVCVRN